MKTRTFFRITLCLPIAAPLAFLPTGFKTVTGILWLSLGFGGIQYVIFATALFVVIGRIDRSDKLTQLLCLAPILFLPVQIGGFLLFFVFDRLSNPNLIGSWDALLPLVFFTLVVGYAYVGSIGVMYSLFRYAGWLRDDNK